MANQLLRHREAHQGQSLVEFALALPVLLLILAGVLEVGNILTQYNRVQQAAREGARFGAEGGTDPGVLAIVKQAASESLSTDAADMDVWVVRPVIDTGCSPDWCWEDWVGQEDHIQGSFGSNPLGDGTSVAADLETTSGYTSAASLDEERFVIVVVRYQVQTILNLSFFQIPGEASGRVPVWAYTVLRQEVDQTAVAQAAGGCSAYPIAFDQAELSGLGEGDTFTLSLADPTSATGQFAFLSWNSSVDLNTHLNAAMTFPGTSLDSTLGYFEWENPSTSDQQLHRGDYVLSNPGTVADAATAIDDHIAKDRAIRVILYSTYPSAADPALSTYSEYQIAGFAIVRIDSRSGNNLTFEFVRLDSSCGFES